MNLNLAILFRVVVERCALSPGTFGVDQELLEAYGLKCKGDVFRRHHIPIASAGLAEGTNDAILKRHTEIIGAVLIQLPQRRTGLLARKHQLLNWLPIAGGEEDLGRPLVGEFSKAELTKVGNTLSCTSTAPRIARVRNAETPAFNLNPILVA